MCCIVVRVLCAADGCHRDLLNVISASYCHAAMNTATTHDDPYNEDEQVEGNAWLHSLRSLFFKPSSIPGVRDVLETETSVVVAD